MATDINTLAEICGVSKSTISRFSPAEPKSARSSATRVLQAARELNYRPQQVMARDCVAIVVNDLPNPNRRTSFSERILNQAVFEITRAICCRKSFPWMNWPVSTTVTPKRCCC